MLIGAACFRGGAENVRSYSFNQRVRVGDLRRYIATLGISPEQFASDVGLSHMTIRRWLKKPDETPIQEKYLTLLGPKLGLETFGPLNVDQMMREIEKTGREFKDMDTLQMDLGTKLKSARLDKIFADYCKKLFRAAKSPHTPLRAKAVVIGALLYFINPVDLIPDSIPFVGYLDDLAVLSIALNYVREFTQEEKHNQR